MLKLSRWLIALAMTVGLVTPALAVPAAITGKWLTTDKDAIVTISKCGNTVCGRITKILVKTPDADQKDVNNPNPKLRNRPVLGLPILTKFKPDGKKWRGRIYDPRGGDEYRSVVTLLKNGKLKVQGCIAIFCDTQYWTRSK